MLFRLAEQINCECQQFHCWKRSVSWSHIKPLFRNHLIFWDPKNHCRTKTFSLKGGHIVKEGVNHHARWTLQWHPPTTLQGILPRTSRDAFPSSGCSSTGFWSCFMTCLQDSPAMSRQKSQVLAKLSTSTSLSSAMKSFSWVCLPMVICSLDAPWSNLRCVNIARQPIEPTRDHHLRVYKCQMHLSIFSVEYLLWFIHLISTLQNPTWWWSLYITPFSNSGRCSNCLWLQLCTWRSWPCFEKTEWPQSQRPDRNCVHPKHQRGVPLQAGRW